MVGLSRLYTLSFFKGCLPQNLLSPLLNTLSHFTSMILRKISERLLDRILLDNGSWKNQLFRSALESNSSRYLLVQIQQWKQQNYV